MSFNIRERFRERKFSYKRKKKLEKETELEQQEDILVKDNPIKVIIFSPLIITGYIKKFFEYLNNDKTVDNDEIHYKKNNISTSLIKDKEKNINSNETTYNKTKIENNSKKNKDNIIQKKQKNNSHYKEKISIRNNKRNNQTNFLENYNNKKNNNILVNNANFNNLETKIFIKLKKILEELDNESKSIESDAYLINKYSKDNELLKEAVIINNKIQKLNDKLKEISNKFAIIKNEKIIQDPTLLEDSLLIEDIINYRNIISKYDINDFTDKLKLLTEYNHLFTNLEELEDKIFNLKTVKENRVEELSKRDNKFNDAKSKINELDEVETRCANIIKEHDKYLNNISSKIEKIEEKKFVDYKLKGLNGLISSSLKYIGLISLTPFKGILPGIAIKTIATRRLISEMIRNIHYEKKEKIIYSVHNYITEINYKIYDIDSVSKNINNALCDIELLKKEFKEYYFKYNLTEYEEVYKKIEKIEKDVVKSKEKVSIIRNELLYKKEINNNVLKKVRKLNSEKRDN